MKARLKKKKWTPVNTSISNMYGDLQRLSQLDLPKEACPILDEFKRNLDNMDYELNHRDEGSEKTPFQFALQFHGEKENPKTTESNPVIRKIIDWSNFSEDDSLIAWCAMFANYVLFHTRYEHSNKVNAKSYLDIGVEVATKDAKVGDIVVLHRGDPKGWKGHVGFYVKHDIEYIWMLGGNQSNGVNIKKYPISRLAGVRRMRKLSEI